ncbi:MAG: 16S rRNA (uracil(1498)-N(3))-methyltransferase [Leptonema sp. (in: Bacteria)]|nr:16S rRNA (uracil(1498)-N(3))-methyltransferase [Leptonema sp. (in: bacteria)]
MFLIYRSFDEFRALPTTIKLTLDEISHLKARRFNITKSEIWLCDGCGKAAPAKLNESSNKSQLCIVPNYEMTQYKQEPSKIVFSALPKGSRIDTLVEKSTELGMTRLIPVGFERSIRVQYSINRLKRIAIQAANQSQRWHLPVFEPILEFEDLVSRVTESIDEINFYLLDKLGQPARTLIEKTKPNSAWPTAVIIGPEGGLTDVELVTLKEAGALSISLSDSILRIETAVIAGITFLNVVN